MMRYYFFVEKTNKWYMYRAGLRRLPNLYCPMIQSSGVCREISHVGDVAKISCNSRIFPCLSADALYYVRNHDQKDEQYEEIATLSEENFIALKDLNVDEIAEELIKIYKLNEEIT